MGNIPRLLSNEWVHVMYVDKDGKVLRGEAVKPEDAPDAVDGVAIRRG